MTTLAQGTITKLPVLKIATMLGVFIGVVIIALALASYLTKLPLDDILQWLKRMFSISFIIIFSLLTALGGIAINHLSNRKLAHQTEYWHEVGQQSGNGIATLALTFTLLGISLGIGTLAEKPLTPDNVQLLVSGLTKQFSMAFMTTVVGLPVATFIRALVGIKYQKAIMLNKVDQEASS
jgi:hypothetical protein